MARGARRRWAMAPGAVIAILCARPAITAACSPPFGIYEREVLPPDGAVGVPLNAEVTVAYGGDLGFSSFYPAVRPVRGELIDAATDRTSTGWHLTAVVRPAAALEPNTTYEVVDRLDVPCEDFVENCVRPDYRVISTFTTGRNADVSAPKFGGLASIDSVFIPEDEFNSCGVYSYVSFTLRWNAAVDDGPPEWVRYQIYDDQDRLRYARHSYGSASGGALCSGQTDPFALDSDFAGPIGGYYVRAVDLAGNEDPNRIVLQTIACIAPTPDAGPWTDAGSPPDASAGAAAGGGGGCGCSVDDTPAVTPFGFLLAWVAPFVRRRSSRSR